MATNGDGEVAVSEALRVGVREAREKRGWSQADLARRVGITQAAVSQIESGSTDSSRYILAICRVLEIDPPMYLQDEDLALWVSVGRRLQRSNSALFRAQLDLLRLATVENSDDDDGKSSKS